MRASIKTYHHGDLRTTLLDEAARMIAEGGVECVTMRAIGQRVGVSRAAPYRHFRDKDALLVAVAAQGFRRLRSRVMSVLSPKSRPSLERFRRMGEEYIGFALDNPAHYRLMYGKEALTRADHPELREAGEALFDLLVRAVRMYQDAGIIRREHPDYLAYVAWSAVHGLASLVIEGQIQPAADITALTKLATRTVLEGMRPHRRRGQPISARH
jgi:AcrR family transcriptional regulator